MLKRIAWRNSGGRERKPTGFFFGCRLRLIIVRSLDKMFFVLSLAKILDSPNLLADGGEGRVEVMGDRVRRRDYRMGLLEIATRGDDDGNGIRNIECKTEASQVSAEVNLRCRENCGLASETDFLAGEGRQHCSSEICGTGSEAVSTLAPTSCTNCRRVGRKHHIVMSNG